jgi:hypothetical protein
MMNIERVLERFKIGEPIKSLFHPVFNVAHIDGLCTTIRLSYCVPDPSGEISRSR